MSCHSASDRPAGPGWSRGRVEQGRAAASPRGRRAGPRLRPSTRSERSKIASSVGGSGLESRRARGVLTRWPAARTESAAGSAPRASGSGRSSQSKTRGRRRAVRSPDRAEWGSAQIEGRRPAGGRHRDQAPSMIQAYRRSSARSRAPPPWRRTSAKVQASAADRELDRLRAGPHRARSRAAIASGLRPSQARQRPSLYAAARHRPGPDRQVGEENAAAS